MSAGLFPDIGDDRPHFVLMVGEGEQQHIYYFLKDDRDTVMFVLSVPSAILLGYRFTDVGLGRAPEVQICVTLLRRGLCLESVHDGSQSFLKFQ